MAAASSYASGSAAQHACMHIHAHLPANQSPTVSPILLTPSPTLSPTFPTSLPSCFLTSLTSFLILWTSLPRDPLFTAAASTSTAVCTAAGTPLRSFLDEYVVTPAASVTSLHLFKRWLVLDREVITDPLRGRVCCSQACTAAHHQHHPPM